MNSTPWYRRMLRIRERWVVALLLVAAFVTGLVSRRRRRGRDQGRAGARRGRDRRRCASPARGVTVTQFCLLLRDFGLVCTYAHLRRSAASLQHRRPDRREHARLHVRGEVGRPARRAGADAERLAVDRDEHPRAEAPRCADLRALLLLGQGRRHEPVRDDAPDEQADPARPLARDEEHAPARPRREPARRPARHRDRRLLRVAPVLRFRPHDDDVQLPRPRDARLLAGADGPGGGGADLRANGAPTSSRSRA